MKQVAIVEICCKSHGTSDIKATKSIITSHPVKQIENNG